MPFLPSRCGACRRTGPSPCRECRAALLTAPPLTAPEPLDELVALLAYEAGARSLVAGLKVRHNRAGLRWLAQGLALLLPGGVDLLTWAPTSPARAAARGADHARLLAEAVAATAGVRCHRTIQRVPGPPQTGRTRAQRLEGPSFTACYDLSGLVVAVVDDVTTTGATLAAAGRAVVAAGARSAVGLAAAATPKPSA